MRCPTNRGSRILCIDNLSTGLFENVSHLKGREGFEFENADVCSYTNSSKVDFVFHLASRPSPEDYRKHPVETALANSSGTHQMLELTRKNDFATLFRVLERSVRRP